MYDVAKLAGVSQPTVSRVLNPSDVAVQISDETRQRVLDAVAQLGYRPNAVARSLRTHRTQTVALLLADLTNGFYHVMARAVQQIAREHDYEVLISNSDHIYEHERHFCEIVLRRGVDGVVMAPQRLSSAEIGTYVSQANIPFAILGRHIEHPNVDVAYVRDEEATYEATTWLIRERLHRQLGFFGVPDYLPPGVRRLRGFTRAVQDAGLEVDARFMRTGDFTLESGYACAQDLIAAGTLPTALVVINDLMAIGVILALKDAGYSVPEDVAVLGFDDAPEATIVRPMLTTIRQDAHQIGTHLAQSLFERIDNPGIVGRRVFECEYELICRQST